MSTKISLQVPDTRTPEQRHFEKMTQTPIARLVSTLAIPTVISMLITSIYSMADTFFVSQLGTSATGAVGIVFSLMAIIQAVGFMLGMGAGNTVARQLGAKEKKAASTTASTAFFCAIAFGIVMLVLGQLFRPQLLSMMGATDTILPYAESYVQYILYAAPFMCASFVMNNILRGEGKAALAMWGIAAGGVLNIVLDPLFIFGLKLGIAGAAIATALSQCIGFCILLSIFLRGKSGVSLGLSYVAPQASVYSRILHTGFPSFCRQGLASLATMLLNLVSKGYGDAVIAAMSIVSRFFMLLFSVMLGFGQGFQPVAGFNYGAKRYDRVRKATIFTLIAGTLMMLVVAIPGFLLAPAVMTLFRSDDLQVIAVGSFAFRAQCLALPLFGLATTANMALQATGRSMAATLLSLCRQGIFFLPLIVALPMAIGVTGIQIAQPVADVFTLLVSVPFLLHFLKEMKQQDAAQRALAHADKGT